jgi:DNA-binding MarR family transcriptional regulator
MAATPAFTPQVLGQTEKALNAILERQLAGTPLTEALWITLSVTMASGETAASGQLLERLQELLRISAAEAEARVDALAGAELLRHEDGVVAITDRGRKLFAKVRGEVGQITERLWGDLPSSDLDTAGRVLGTILVRANEELAAA